MFSPSKERHKTKWIIDRCDPFESYLAGSLVPGGFEAYARILHPANGLHGESNVTLAEIAEWSGRVYHPAMQLESIGTPLKGFGGEPKPWDGHRPPSMPLSQLKTLSNLLSNFTQTPDSIWCLVWEGHVGSVLQGTVRPIIKNPYRKYYLYKGGIEAFGQTGFTTHHFEPPEYWFPGDHSWCVATDMDLFWTYVGGSKTCIDAILQSSHLEAVPAKLNHGLTMESDRINRLTEEEKANWLDF